MDLLILTGASDSFGSQIGLFEGVWSGYMGLVVSVVVMLILTQLR